MKTWKRIRSFDRERSFKPWIYRIARNACIDHFRKHNDIPLSAWEDEEGENALEDSITDPSPLPLELLERSEVREQLKSALKKLSEIERTILFLHYEEDCSRLSTVQQPIENWRLSKKRWR